MSIFKPTINKKNKFFTIFKIKEKPSEVDKKYINKTYKYISYIKNIPGIRFVGLGNSIGMNCAKKSSDIDLFIVTTANRLWLNRIIITIIFQLLGVRKSAKKHSARFCLSFFATTKAIDFGSFILESDIYMYYWILTLKPVLNYNKTYEKILKYNSKYFDYKGEENKLKNNKNYIKYTGNKINSSSKILNLCEKILKNIFLKKTLNNYDKLGKPYGIIINDNLLKFHNNDIRKKISQI